MKNSASNAKVGAPNVRANRANDGATGEGKWKKRNPLELVRLIE
jgi:hypothetical protein